MCSRFLSIAVALLFATICAAHAAPLRICADPDNLPFSNRAEQGFDNRIAILIAHELRREPQFVWARSRRGFLREQFDKGACDLLMGVPQGMRGVASSSPYYRSSYVFVTPARTHVQITRFDDPNLNSGRIGLQVLEEDYAPPSLPLIRYGHAGQLVGFDAFGQRSEDIVKAVADGRVACAVVWGPLAGYFAKRDHLPVTIAPVSGGADTSGVPLAYSMTIAVHRRDAELREQIDRAITSLQPRINAILARYSIPRDGDGKGGR
ncbi:quinoprotein dehydrogenase-associated putative ABC transporter substrate-binding protein [Occallatibacter riparius]|uniref:Quinoprotein dehydrogenase-associated putative ABC transporter substrate-binding protein n=1 Tax=Occallatibacter riparius TaxID=1002689 RepID=A0A9J7BTA6_9BACT|nr:quinoprotein dehydrogenase-associated putative ABC transporter substrate-binding protein [Occallatibacter riparius]UWZ84134.1 quinoprotein dehydrogenase-associated putative ABC transporter substrate-binding protein [Occallatibacter riparius]